MLYNQNFKNPAESSKTYANSPVQDSTNPNAVFCPRCGSNNIDFNVFQEYSGSHSVTTTKSKYKEGGHGVIWWLLIGWWWWIVDLCVWFFAFIPRLILHLFASSYKTKNIKGKSRSTTNTENKIGYKTIYVCKNCGNNWRDGAEKVNTNSSGWKNIPNWIAPVVVGIIVLSVMVSISTGGEKETDVSTNVENQSNTEIIKSESVWADEYTPISSFYYKLNEKKKTITLIRFKGEETKILLSPIYTIGGEDYKLVSMGDDACFLCETNITSVYIPEGVKKIDSTCFNSCTSLEYIYLPSTLNNIPSDFFSYLGNYEINFKSKNLIDIPLQRDMNDYPKEKDERSDAEELGEDTARALNGILGGISQKDDKIVNIYYGAGKKKWKGITS